MKGFPPVVEGPLGPWYQKVNAAIRSAEKVNAVQELRNILGDPDSVEVLSDEERRGEADDAPIDPRHPAQMWEYPDPYRRGRFYRFDVSEKGRVMGFTRVTRKPST